MVMQIGGYNCILGRSEDRDLWLRLSERGKISCIREPLVFVRKHEQQLSHSLDGLQQLIDSYIAMTVYWIRRLGFPDPLDGASPEEVNRFRGWLEKRMQDEGLLASLGLFATLKKSWLSNSTFARKSLSLASLCYYRPRLVLCYLQVRSGRSRLPVCFAYDWIKAQP
jgi:hypothetical protein